MPAIISLLAKYIGLPLIEKLGKWILSMFKDWQQERKIIKDASYLKCKNWGFSQQLANEISKKFADDGQVFHPSEFNINSRLN